MNILFYNLQNNGDCYVSRNFIKDIKNKIDAKIYYGHKHKKNYLFNDINLEEVDLNKNDLKYNFIFDTWYATENHKYFKTGCTIQTLYKIFSDIYKTLNIPIGNIEEYIPSIDYKIYGLNEEERNKNSVLVCTNKPLSSQSNSDDMGYFVNEISKRLPEKLFFITNDVNGLEERKNVFYTKNILKNNNLIELSWFSTQCSSIIGRSSGPYTFSITKKNIEEGLNFFDIIYTNPVGDFSLCNFGLHDLGYNNFYNVCARCNWNEIIDFIEKNREKL